MAFLFSLALTTPALAGGDNWMFAGGPVSDALEAAIEAKDAEGLKSQWSGKMLFIDKETKSTREISADEIFRRIDGCQVSGKFDVSPYATDFEKRTFKGTVAWRCPAQRDPKDDCSFRTYFVEIGAISFFSRETAFYVGSDFSGYDDKKCGAPRPPIPGEEVN